MNRRSKGAKELERGEVRVAWGFVGSAMAAGLLVALVCTGYYLYTNEEFVFLGPDVEITAPKATPAPTPVATPKPTPVPTRFSGGALVLHNGRLWVSDGKMLHSPVVVRTDVISIQGLEPTEEEKKVLDAK